MKKYQTNELIDAVFRGSESEVLAVLDTGFHIDHCDTDGRTALIHAATDKKIALVRLLAHQGASVRIVDGLGMTALHYAAQNYDLDCCQFLVSQGAEIDAQDKNGNTPLMKAEFAARNSETALQDFLIAKGADFHLKNYHGVSTEVLRNY